MLQYIKLWASDISYGESFLIFTFKWERMPAAEMET